MCVLYSSPSQLIYGFLRQHLSKLMAILSPFESGKATLDFLETFESKARNIAGKSATEDPKKKTGVPGLNKLKVVDESFLERPSRRLLREGKFLAQVSCALCSFPVSLNLIVHTGEWIGQVEHKEKGQGVWLLAV